MRILYLSHDHPSHVSPDSPLVVTCYSSGSCPLFPLLHNQLNASTLSILRPQAPEPATTAPTRPNLLSESPPPPYRLKDPNPKRPSEIGTDGTVDAGNATKKRRIEGQSGKRANLVDVARDDKASSSPSKLVSLRTRSAAAESRKTRRLVVTNPDPDVSADANEEGLSPPLNLADNSSKRALRRSTLDKKFDSHILAKQDDKDLISANATSSTIAAPSKKLDEQLAWLATAYSSLLAFIAVPVRLENIHHFAFWYLPDVGIALAKQLLEANPQIVKVNITSSGTPHLVGRCARHLSPFFFAHRTAVSGSPDIIPDQVALEFRSILLEILTHAAN